MVHRMIVKPTEILMDADGKSSLREEQMEGQRQ